MTLKELIKELEQWAPPTLQESYDNSGLIVGDTSMEVKGILCSLDATEEVVEEAIKQKCNVIVAHHPIVFSGLKRLTGKNYVERTVIKAIKNDVAIYAIHTNLDNVATGVNKEIANRIGLVNDRILSSKSGLLQKLVFFTPKDQAEEVLEALFEAGGGHIGNYSDCAFRSEGTGSFKGNKLSNPSLGKPLLREYAKEVKAELIVPKWMTGKLTGVLKSAHPYEEVAYDVIQLENKHPEVGAGRIGEFEKAIEEREFLELLKDVFRTPCIKHTRLLNKPIKKVALCGGSGSFLINSALAQGVDAYFTGDIKYHEFFDAEDKLLLCDIGHFESEQYTIDALESFISKKFPSFVVYKSQSQTNPVQYY